jgi:hypothetical protein
MHNDTHRSSLRPCHVPPTSSTCEVETPSTRAPSFASLLPSPVASTSHACAGARRQPWPMEQAPCHHYSLAFMLPHAELAPQPVPPSSSPSRAHLGRPTRRRSTVAACRGHRSQTASVVASPRATTGQAMLATSFAMPYYTQSNSALVPLPPLGSLLSCHSVASRELSWPGPCGPWQGGLRPS